MTSEATMVEKVGARMVLASRAFDQDVRICELTDDEWRVLARAAIAAMRTPTPVMIEAGDEAVEQDSSDTNGSWFYRYYDGDSEKVWSAMVDAAHVIEPATPGE